MGERLTAKERHILRHTLGLTRSKESYRNRFVTGPDTDDWPMVQALCTRGLMVARGGPQAIIGGMTVFQATDAGRIAAMAPGDDEEGA